MKNLLKNILFIAFGLFCVYFSLKNQSIEELYSYVKKADFFWVSVILLVMTFSHFFRAIRWIYLIEPLGYKPRLKTTFFAVLIGYLINYGIPRMGEVVKCTLVSKKEKIPADKLVGTMVTERILDMITLLILIVVAFLIEGDNLLNYIQTARGENIGEGSIHSKIIFLIFMLLGALAIWIYMKVIRVKFSENKIIQKLESIRENLWLGLTSVFKLPKQKLIAMIGYSISIWLCYALGMYFGFKTLSELNHLTMSNGLVLLCTSSLGMILPSPGGVGVVQYMLQKSLVIYHIPDTIGLTYGWLVWISQLVLILILGLYSLVAINFIKLKDSKTS